MPGALLQGPCQVPGPTDGTLARISGAGTLSSYSVDSAAQAGQKPGVGAIIWR
jgi:hypothetical protein